MTAARFRLDRRHDQANASLIRANQRGRFRYRDHEPTPLGSDERRGRFPALGSGVRGRATPGRTTEAPLFQRAIPHGKHLVPGFLGREGVVDRPLGERETVLGAGKHLKFVLDAVLFQKAFQLARDMRRYAAIGLGEGVIEFALDPVEEQVGRILLVGNDADPVQRRGRGDPMPAALRVCLVVSRGFRAGKSPAFPRPPLSETGGTVGTGSA